jgi:exonuclease III
MRILSWNLRECRSSKKRHYLKEFLNKEHIDVVRLQETKIDKFSTRMFLSISIFLNASTLYHHLVF